MDAMMFEFNDLKVVVEDTLCPLTTCLFENQNMQMAAEE